MMKTASILVTAMATAFLVFNNALAAGTPVPNVLGGTQNALYAFDNQALEQNTELQNTLVSNVLKAQNNAVDGILNHLKP